MGKLGAMRLLPDELEQRIEEYFKHCEESKREIHLKSGDIKYHAEWPSIIGLCLWLDIGKDTWRLILNGDMALDWLDCASQREHPINRAYRDRATGELDKKALAALYSAIFKRARARIEHSILSAASCGYIPDRLAQLILGNMGYSAGPDADSSGSVTVRWGSVPPEDADRYSR